MDQLNSPSAGASSDRNAVLHMVEQTAGTNLSAVELRTLGRRPGYGLDQRAPMIRVHAHSGLERPFGGPPPDALN